MKVLVIPAEHATGLAVVDSALDRGHDVTAIVEDAATFPRRHDRLEVLDRAEADEALLRKAVLGKDAVLSLVDVPHRRPTTAYSDTAADLVEAMEQAASPGRVVCVSSSYVDADGPGFSPLRRLYVKLIVHRRYRNPLNDMKRMEAEWERSGVDWTVVRAPRLTEASAAGTYRIASDGHVPGGRTLSRDDLAAFLVRILDDPKTYRTIVEIAS